MLRYWKPASALLVLSLGLAACPGPQEKEGTPSLLLAVDPRKVENNGQSTTVRVTATDAMGEPGTGTVTLKARAGLLEGELAELTLPLANGQASTTYSCDISVDSRCSGFVLIDGLWNETMGSTSVQIGASTGGTDGGTGGGTDGGTGGGTDGGTGTGGTTLAVSASRNPIFFNVGDYSLITATLKRSDAGWADQQIEFSTTLGGLTASDGGTLTQTFTASTDNEGKAVARFQETGSAGTAGIEARHAGSGAATSISVNVTTVQQIIYKSTLCNGSACTIMGVRGSGFNEQAQVTFRLVDSQNKPASGVPVTFSIPNAPTGTTVSPSGVSNSLGEVTATVASGRLIGAFVVHAVAIPGEVEVDSPTIGIRGAKSANNGFALKCDLVNIATYVSASPPASISVPCTVKVVDRFNNPVGTGTTVNFKVEAGSITNSVNTTPYSPTSNNDKEGMGSVTFSTLGGTPMPVDVTPLEAHAAQFPRQRFMEPRWNVGQLVNNPRDSLVTIVAYTRGEEYFSDTNSNGLRDADEQFIDMGEPFVDSNDNGVWDVGETYIDEAPADGQWNGPNGTWDNDTTIWTETRILYTGRPVSERSFLMGYDFATYPPTPQPFSGACGSGVAKGSYELAHLYCADEFFNRPQAQGTAISATHTANKGSVQSLVSGLQDGYGFEMERRKLNAADPLQDCTPSTNACIWKMLFFDWGYGDIGQVKINGAAPTDTQPCQSDTLLATCTVQNVGLTVGSPGAIE